jgi:transposase
VEWKQRITDKVPGTFFSLSENREEKMIERFHGIDRHKKHFTASVLNREGKEIEFVTKCVDLRGYIEKLGAEDAVIVEASAGAFYWADLMESQGTVCYVLDPFKFKIIRDSWNKTDKQDARNMAKALWIYLVTGEFGIPTVYKPSMEIRELRKLFCQYRLFSRQMTMLKNNIQAIFVDNGVDLNSEEKVRVLSKKHGEKAMAGYEVSPASRVSLELNLDLLWKVEEQKEKIKKEILLAGEPFSYEVKLLITVRGITPLSALAFLADVADIERFRTLRKMNAYLGLVQKVRESGGKSKPGHINRASRSLTRTLLTQSVMHFADASPQLRRYYSELSARRGAGRARIALIRKVCGIMRRMLLDGEQFRGMKEDNFERKWKRYENQLKRIKKERKIA